MLKSLYQQMISIRENLENEVYLRSVGYCKDDRDSGYRSSLRALGLSRSKRTDAVANHVIYRQNTPIPAGLLDEPIGQLSLDI